ncbi:hypothetical protein ANCDUO_02989 [Ancylostoma duodenale]|uniref:Uncharacterized protein n=1 Tax=Ancylostoma duodenale TaxID=51022 RepID=A0A0C2GYU8_9BILA|nr:hypothetical protein ANCDUO_02989 [Ancylostoma duodenale]
MRPNTDNLKTRFDSAITYSKETHVVAHLYAPPNTTKQNCRRRLPLGKSEDHTEDCEMQRKRLMFCAKAYVVNHRHKEERLKHEG